MASHIDKDELIEAIYGNALEIERLAADLMANADNLRNMMSVSPGSHPDLAVAIFQEAATRLTILLTERRHLIHSLRIIESEEHPDGPPFPEPEVYVPSTLEAYEAAQYQRARARQARDN